MNSPTLPPGRPRPVLVMASVVAGLQFVVAGGQLAELLPAPWPAVVGLVVGAITIGWGVYTHGQVTPLAAPRDRRGRPLVTAPIRHSWPADPTGEPPADHTG